MSRASLVCYNAALRPRSCFGAFRKSAAQLCVLELAEEIVCGSACVCCGKGGGGMRGGRATLTALTSLCCSGRMWDCIIGPTLRWERCESVSMREAKVHLWPEPSVGSCASLKVATFPESRRIARHCFEHLEGCLNFVEGRFKVKLAVPQRWCPMLRQNALLKSQL